ncbi:MAG: hypothetical protein ABJN34_00020 [Litoreibacter sp.]|uniref:hypothetical protein n=1 Tax=Litoreibacter sp. TaxID=1969459 RepID=UPI0032987F7B
MSVSQSNSKPLRPAPFSLRLTPEERERLEAQSGAMPLASYIKSVVLSDEAPKYRKRTRPPVAEQQLLAAVLAKLGSSRTASNLNQIAKGLNQGTLVVDEELEADLNAAIAEVAWMRATLMQALGIKS